MIPIWKPEGNSFFAECTLFSVVPITFPRDQLLVKKVFDKIVIFIDELLSFSHLAIIGLD